MRPQLGPAFPYLGKCSKLHIFIQQPELKLCQEPSWPMLRFAQNRIFAAWEVMSPTPKAFYCWIPVDIISDLWNSPLSLAGDGDGILEGW